MLLLIRDSSLIIVRFVHCYIRDTIQRFIIPRSQRNSFSKTLWHSVKRWTYHSFLSYHRQARLMSNTGWWWMLFLASVLKGMHGHHLEMHYQSWRMLTFLFAQWTSLQVNNNNDDNYYNELEVAHLQSGSSSTWFLIELEFGNVGFWGEGKPEYPKENLSEQRREPTTNSTHTSMAPTPGFEPGPHWWKASAVTTVPSLRQMLSPLHHPLFPRLDEIEKKCTIEL